MEGTISTTAMESSVATLIFSTILPTTEEQLFPTFSQYVYTQYVSLKAHQICTKGLCFDHTRACWEFSTICQQTIRTNILKISRNNCCPSGLITRFQNQKCRKKTRCILRLQDMTVWQDWLGVIFRVKMDEWNSNIWSSRIIAIERRVSNISGHNFLICWRCIDKKIDLLDSLLNHFSSYWTHFTQSTMCWNMVLKYASIHNATVKIVTFHRLNKCSWGS